MQTALRPSRADSDAEGRTWETASELVTNKPLNNWLLCSWYEQLLAGSLGPPDSPGLGWGCGEDHRTMLCFFRAHIGDQGVSTCTMNR